MTYNLIKDIAFGKLKNQDADLLLPKSKSSPLVVLIHGGAWVGSCKEDFHYFAELLAGFGYAVLNLNYRLVPDGASGQDMLEDIHTGIKLILSRAEEYNIYKDALALAGCSAGAHLALLYAYKGICPIKVPLVFNMVGPTDLTDISYLEELGEQEAAMMLNVLSALSCSNLKDLSLDNIPQELFDLSPLYHITKNAPRTISAYGALDTLVPLSQGLKLNQKLQEVAGKDKSELIIFPNSDHSLAADKDIYTLTINKLQKELAQLLPLKK